MHVLVSWLPRQCWAELLAEVYLSWAHSWQWIACLSWGDGVDPLEPVVVASLLRLADFIQDTWWLDIVRVRNLSQLEAWYYQSVLRLLVLGAVELSVLDPGYEGWRLVVHLLVSVCSMGRAIGCLGHVYAVVYCWVARVLFNESLGGWIAGGVAAWFNALAQWAKRWNELLVLLD